MNPLGDAIRSLMSRRGLTGAQLGADIGLSATSVSRIIQGHSKPKQVTLSRLMKRLCVNSQDEQTLLRAFTGIAVPTAEEPVSFDRINVIEERERVERWLESRTQAINFKDAISRELEQAGLPFRRDFCEGIASTDFLIERGARRVAIETKFNVARDFEKTVGVARLVHTHFRCRSVIIVVPYEGSFLAAIDQHLDSYITHALPNNIVQCVENELLK